MSAQLSAIPLTLTRRQASESRRERAWRFAATAVTVLTASCAVVLVSLATVLLELGWANLSLRRVTPKKRNFAKALHLSLVLAGTRWIAGRNGEQGNE
jgi:hypothetical protein